MDVDSDIRFYKEHAEHIVKPSGHIIMGGEEVANTLQCCHCGTHWIVLRGSGRIRGYCSQCRKPTCGSEACMACIPYDAKLEFMEGKENAFTDQIKENLIIHHTY